ncbi:MAG: hypothetical protein ACKORB_06920 [Opitutia bacterium]
MRLTALFSLLACSAPLAGGDVLSLGGRLEPFFDLHLVAESKGASLRLHEPRDEGAVMKFDQPWEGAFCAYCTVIDDRGTLRLYYRGKKNGGPDGTGEVTCYAESSDGRSWRKPATGLGGAPAGSNVILDEPGVTHNFSPFLDARPGVPAAERFKALGGVMNLKGGPSGLFAFVSADGIRWRKLRAEPVLTKGAFDSQNVAFWSETEGRYVAFFRTFTAGTTDGGAWRPAGLRTVSRADSADFLAWSETAAMAFRPAQEHHYYTSQTQPYFRAPHLFVSTAARWVPGRRPLTDEEAAGLRIDPGYYRSAKDASDCVFMTSRDGRTFDRNFAGALIRPGLELGQWVSRTGYPVLNIVRTGPAEMSLFTNQDYAQPTSHLRRHSWRLDGIASMHAPAAGGEFTTRPFRFAGRFLRLNLATSAAGSVKVEILGEDGVPVPGRTLADSHDFAGNRLAHDFRWKGGADLSDLAGRPIRLRFVLRDADVHSLQFAP